jgi:fumarylacetoacetate (FAA) hydrolase
MKLATLRDGSRDGRLVVVCRRLEYAVDATAIAPTLQNAIERWSEVEPALNALYEALNRRAALGTFAFNVHSIAAPLPRAYQWCDASALALPHRYRGLINGVTPRHFLPMANGCNWRSV